MKKWYNTSLTKGVLIIMAHVLTVFMISYLLVAGEVSYDVGFLPSSSGGYADSPEFKNLFYDASYVALDQISRAKAFETNGKYDPDKAIDVNKYGKNDRLKSNGFAEVCYYLDELVEWSYAYEEEYNSGHTEYQTVVVCQKPDDTYHYYYQNEFEKLVNDGRLKIMINNQDVSASYMKAMLNNEEYVSSSDSDNGNPDVVNKNNELLYTNCWTMDHMINEKYPPIKAGSLVELVNQNPELNGKLEMINNDLQLVLSNIKADYELYQANMEKWSEGNTNFIYIYIDDTNQEVWTNRKEYQGYDKADLSIVNMKAADNIKYFIVRNKLADFESNINFSAGSTVRSIKEYSMGSGKWNGTFVAAVDMNLPIQDGFYQNSIDYGRYVPFIQTFTPLFIISILLLLVIIIWLTVIAGSRSVDGEIQLNWFDRWKTEIAAVIVIVFWAVIVFLLFKVNAFNVRTSYLSGWNLTLAGITGVCTIGLFLIGYLSLVRRIKAKTVWKNSILCMFFEAIRLFWNNRNIIWKSTLAVCGFILLHWIAFGSLDVGIFILVLILFDFTVISHVIINAVARNRIKKGIWEIAAGHVDYQIPLNGLKGENMAVAGMVNNIGNGLQQAVAEGMKSERMKTDLITNVSHDIKTPLTSIINYVDLLKRESIDDPKIQGYLDILEAKAERLKVLTEDVVEASKVSSGNITLECMDLNLVELLNQAGGEFAERLAGKELTLVSAFPEEPVMVHVDGQRLWRVLENVFGNAVKYALPGTRVYADLIKEKEKIIFSLKNVSEQPLNISADELTERFIRGDISRSTEGSGLGLSIARSLTELMGGSFNLYLDGDLFKVTMEFPAVLLYNRVN